MSVQTAHKPLVGSFTLLNQYLNCPHAMFHKFIAKTYPYVESLQQGFGNRGHKAFEERIGNKKPLPEEFSKYEHFAVPFDAHLTIVEQKLGMTREGKPTGFFDKDVWFRGKLDTSILSNGSGYMADWKFGSSKYEDPFELEVGAVLLQAKYPKATKLVGRYVYPVENKLGQLYDLSNTDVTFARMKHLMDEIERDRATGWYEKRKSGLCGYCSVEDCEHHFVARPKNG